MDVVRTLAVERVRDLDDGVWRPAGDGWTCDTFEVTTARGERWIVQSPRSSYAAERLRAQGEALPGLATEVSAPVPSPVAPVGEPPLLIYRAIDGVACTDGPDGLWPERLGRFLFDLHAVPPEFAGLRAEGASTCRERERAALEELLDRVSPVFEAGERDRVRAVARDLIEDDALWALAPVVTHGDLGPEHVLVTPAGDLAGVIDWEEISVDDPAVDLAWWLHAMPGEGERILGAYGGAPDRGFGERARLRFLIMPWHEIAYGLAAGGETFVASGLAGARERLERWS